MAKPTPPHDPITIEYGYRHIEPGDPRNPRSYRICGARTRNAEARSAYCQQPAGLRTAHPGVGRCWLHGGRLTAGPGHPRWRNGRYAHIWRGRLAEHFRAIQEDTDDPLDLLPELEARRVLLAMALDDLNRTALGLDVDDELHAAGDELVRQLRAMPGDDQGAYGMPGEDGEDDERPMERSVPGRAGGTGDSTKSTIRIPSGQGYGAGQKALEQEIAEKIKAVNAIADGVVNTVSQIIASRNQTALTMTEVQYLRMKMVEGIERFLPDPERRAAFIEWLIAELPGGAKADRGEAGAGSIELPAAAEAEEAD